jgi:ATP-dependent Clp protease ATP-binding subunit ClpB
MTDGQGRVVDFRNTIVIMTSNIGQAHIMHCLSGHEPTEERIEQATTLAVSELKTRVAPEFINRIDNIVMFLPLTLDDVRNIARLQVNKLTKQLAEQNISLTTDDAVVEFIATQGFDPQYGARPVKRAINTLLKDKLIDNMVNGIVTKTLPISATVNNDTIVFTNIPTAE